jgi:hypothetical protein
MHTQEGAAQAVEAADDAPKDCGFALLRALETRNKLNWWLSCETGIDLKSIGRYVREAVYPYEKNEQRIRAVLPELPKDYFERVRAMLLGRRRLVRAAQKKSGAGRKRRAPRRRRLAARA